MIIQSEKELLDWLSGASTDEQDKAVCQYYQDETLVSLADAMWDLNPNDFWWYLDNGDIRVFTTEPTKEELNSPWLSQ